MSTAKKAFYVIVFGDEQYVKIETRNGIPYITKTDYLPQAKLFRTEEEALSELHQYQQGEDVELDWRLDQEDLEECSVRAIYFQIFRPSTKEWKPTES